MIPKSLCNFMEKSILYFYVVMLFQRAGKITRNPSGIAKCHLNIISLGSCLLQEEHLQLARIES